MAGVDFGHELLSWSEFESYRLVYGSRFSTRIAETLIKLQIPELDLDNKDDELTDLPAYMTLVETVNDILVKEVDVRERTDISFLTPVDALGMKWRQRTEILLSGFQLKFQVLKTPKTIPQADYYREKQELSNHEGPVRLTDSIITCKAVAEYYLTNLSYKYMHAFPGNNSAAKNISTHGLCITMLKAEKLSPSDLEKLAAHLQYRLMIIACATEYKNRLGLQAEDCEKFDCDAHYSQICENSKRTELYSANFQVWGELALRGLDLFDQPAEHEGHDYAKGVKYISTILAEAEWE